MEKNSSKNWEKTTKLLENAWYGKQINRVYILPVVPIYTHHDADMNLWCTISQHQKFTWNLVNKLREGFMEFSMGGGYSPSVKIIIFLKKI